MVFFSKSLRILVSALLFILPFLNLFSELPKNVHAVAEPGGGPGGVGATGGGGGPPDSGVNNGSGDPSATGDPGHPGGTSSGTSTSSGTNPEEEGESTDGPPAEANGEDSGGGPLPSEPDLSTSTIACNDTGNTILSWKPSNYTRYYNVWQANLDPAAQVNHGLTGQYFDEKELTQPIKTRVDPEIKFNWGLGAPDPILSPESFSVRWIGKILTKSAGEYTFIVNAKDGVRLYIDDEKIINQWSNSTSPREISGRITLGAEEFHNIRLEYYNNKDEAQIELKWAEPNGAVVTIPSKQLFPSYSNGMNTSLVEGEVTEEQKPILFNNGLYAQYYDGNKIDNAKDPDLFRIDQMIDFKNWSNPDPVVDPKFAVSWSGKIKAKATGKFTFYVKGKDGIRLFIGDTDKEHRIINEWSDKAQEREVSATYDLIKDQLYTISLEHYLKSGPENFQLFWEAPTVSSGLPVAKEVITKEYLFHQANLNFKTGLYAQYFDNNKLEGVPSFSLNESGVNHDWGTSQPNPLVTADNFSVRWVGLIKIPEGGEYFFNITTDGEVQLGINNDIVLKKNADGKIQTLSGKVDLEKDQLYTIKLEYRHTKGPAQIQLKWTKPSGQNSVDIPSESFMTTLFAEKIIQKEGIFAKYFDNKKLNALAFSQTEANIDSKAWPVEEPPNPKGESPNPVIDPDTFSIRFSGKIKAPETGSYTFISQVNDGVKLFIDNKNVLDQWKDINAAESLSGKIDLKGSKTYDFRLEFYENLDLAKINLSWKKPGSSQTEPVPDELFTHTIVDGQLINFLIPASPSSTDTAYQITSVGSGGRVPSQWIYVSNGSCTPITPIVITSCNQLSPVVNLTWSPIPNVVSYKIYRSDNPLNPIGTVQASQNTEFTDNTPAPNTYYAYSVNAVSYLGVESAYKWIELTNPQNNSNLTPDCSPPVINLFLTSKGKTLAYNDFPLVVKQNDPVSISWNTTNVPVGPNSCTAFIPSTDPAPAQDLINSWSNGKAEAGNQALPPINTIGNYQFRLTCSSPEGVSGSSNIILKVDETKKPWFKTTGGDVHTNEGIHISE